MSEGNRKYMQVVSSFLPIYVMATTNQDKIQITKDVVAHVKSSGGRFMGVDAKGNLYVVPDNVARVKVAQVSLSYSMHAVYCGYFFYIWLGWHIYKTSFVRVPHNF